MLSQSIYISNFVPKILIKTINNINYKLFFDGCSKGNPGLAGAGAVIYKNDEEIWSECCFVGDKITNNHAEYYGLILGLRKAIDLNITSLLVMGDSQLVINHMTGKYKCKSPNLIPHYQTAKNLEINFDTIKYQHILRNLNKRADELSNLGLK
jgi:ribonuclease HI